MDTYVVIDFETNGFAEQKGEKQACLYYLRSYVDEKIQKLVQPISQKKYTEIINNAYNVPAILTPFDLPTDWPRLEDAEAFENMFNKTWSIGEGYGDWQDRLFREALRYCGLSWSILESEQGCFLCYGDDIEALKKNPSQYKSFDANNKDHIQAVLETCFGPTVLSCALLVLTDRDKRVDIYQYQEFVNSKSKNASCYYQVYTPDEHHKQSSRAERVHRMSESWLKKEGVDITDLFRCLGLLKKRHPNFKFVAHNAPADRTFLKKCIEKQIRFSQYNNILYPDPKFKWDERVKNLNILLQNLIKEKKWLCTLQAARQCLKLTPEDEASGGYSLGNVYETITHKKMPKMHDAQMDVYACATIYCYASEIADTKALQDLITAITPAVILSHKAVDFWRYALIGKLNDPTLLECKQKREIPAENFRDFEGWWMCLKMDGFYVRLKRDGDRWRIFTRKGIELNPPRSFLQNFSMGFPDGMEIEGEVVFDTDQTCELEYRKSAEKRIEKRYKDFSKLRISSLRSKKDFSAWHRLRIVVFAFPIADKTFQESWEEGLDVMHNTEHAPEHIVTCRYIKVQTTADAIEIFKGVVQMGLEGLVIRDPNARYTSDLIHQKKDSPVFKMKQKIVTESEQSFKETGTSKRDKDGKIKEEKEYTVTAFRARDQDNPKTCKFTEWRPCNPVDANKNISQKLKFFEKASKWLGWGMNNIGIRHLCLATDQDVTFEVPAVLDGKIQREAFIKGLKITSEPFQFNLETVYLFLACRIHEKKIKIAMIRFVGKTPEDVKRHGFLHEDYDSQDHEKFVECFMKFLQHSPYDNKKFVLVMQDKNVKKAFIEYAENAIRSCENKMKDYEYCKNVIRRLKTQDASQKQQIEVVLMEEVIRNVRNKEGDLLKRYWPKGDYFIKTTNVAWNFDYTAGRISEKQLTGQEKNFDVLCKEDFNTLNHLISPNISDDVFDKLCEIQFEICVRLQELWRKLDKRITKVVDLGELPEYIELTVLEDMYFGITKLDITYYNELNSLGAVYRHELKHQALYNSLSEYDKRHNKNGKITLDEFKVNFRAAREREASCMNDPRTGKFPYGGNMWHVAWRMSYGFFKHHNLLYTEEETSDFTYTGRELWKDATESQAPIAPRYDPRPVRVPERLNSPPKKRPVVESDKVKPRIPRTGAKIKRQLGRVSSSEDEDNEAGGSSTSTSNPKNENELSEETHTENEKKRKEEPVQEEQEIIQQKKRREDNTPQQLVANDEKPSQRALNWLDRMINEKDLVDTKLQKIKALLQVLKTYAL